MRLLTAVSGVRVPQQAPEKKPNGFFFIFLFLLLSRTPYAVFGLHDSRVQNRCRKCAIPSHGVLLTAVRVRGQAPEKKPNGFFFCFIVPVIISNPLRCFRPARLPRAEQMPKMRYSVARCAPYGGSCPRAGAGKETLAGFFFILLFPLIVSFLELLIFRFLSGQMFSVPKEKAAERM